MNICQSWPLSHVASPGCYPLLPESSVSRDIELNSGMQLDELGASDTLKVPIVNPDNLLVDPNGKAPVTPVSPIQW